jgi:8-oxo-dGTP diphosphatase
VRSYHPSWAPTLGLSYVATADRSGPLRPEPGQHAAWQPLDVDWRSYFADDPVRLRRYAAAARENLRPSAQEHHGSG